MKKLIAESDFSTVASTASEEPIQPGTDEAPETVGNRSLADLPDTGGFICAGHVASTPARRSDRRGAREDYRLVQRCLRGEVDAWEELFSQCHGPLRTSIKMWLGPGQRDPDLVDELASRVWSNLIENDGELLAKYDPRRGGRVITFLRAVARDEAGRHFRAERRRMQRELAALRDRPNHHPSDLGEPLSNLAEFLATLTPHERGFCGQYLLASSGDTGEQAPQQHSSANVWQLSRRIYHKLLRFLAVEP